MSPARLRAIITDIEIAAAAIAHDAPRTPAPRRYRKR